MQVVPKKIESSKGMVDGGWMKGGGREMVQELAGGKGMDGIPHTSTRPREEPKPMVKASEDETHDFVSFRSFLRSVSLVHL